MASTEHLQWGAEALWQELEPLLPGLSIEVLARIGSTNTALLERVRQQAEHEQRRAQNPARRVDDLRPCLLVAENQTQGRGRMGRTWHSTPGASLTFSLGLTLDAADLSGLSLAVGATLAEAMETAPAAVPRLTLKWPNDLWLDGRKLGGILIETIAAGARRMVVIGVGINVLEAARPSEGHLASGFAALEEIHVGIDAPHALALVARPLVEMLANYNGFAPHRAAFEHRDGLRGHPITAGTLEGVAAGLAEDGALLIQTDEGVKSVSGGEVTVRLKDSN